MEGDYRVFHLKNDITQSILSISIAIISMLGMLRTDAIALQGPARPIPMDGPLSGRIYPYYLSCHACDPQNQQGEGIMIVWYGGYLLLILFLRSVQFHAPGKLSDHGI